MIFLQVVDVIEGGLGAVGKAHLVQDAADVYFDGFFADRKLG